MKPIRIILIILLIIGALVAVKKIFLTTTVSSPPPASAKEGKGQPASVTGLVAVVSEVNESFFVTGSINASEEVNLRPEVSGKIVKLPFAEGSIVKKGDLLCKLNDADLQAQLKNLREQEKLSKEKELRLKELLKLGAITQEEYEQSLNALQILQADVEILIAQISKTEILAPFNGTIGLRYVSVGSMISQTDKIALLAQLDPVKLDFSVPEKYASAIQKNQDIFFFVEGSAEKHSAKVYAIEPKVDLETRTLNIRATCDNPNGKFIPGAFARVTVPLKAKENTVLLPSQALIPVLKGNKVFISRNGLAEEAMVVTGLRTESEVQILEGVSAGDTVIISGVMMLRKGMPINVTKIEGGAL